MKCSPEKEVSFDWDEALSFDRNSALYIIYNYARIQSIFKTANPKSLEQVDFSLLSSDTEIELLTQIAAYPEVIKNAVDKLDVFDIAK